MELAQIDKNTNAIGRNLKGEYAMSTEKETYLGFIQNIITRMNKNSFQIKGWQTGIVSALIVLSTSMKNAAIIYIALFPTVIFWLLDAYYLLQERKFRGLYNDAAGLTAKPLVATLYSMNIGKYNRSISKNYTYWNVLKSKTIWPLYVGIVAVIIVTA
jgi:hypothetical protein